MLLTVYSNFHHCCLSRLNCDVLTWEVHMGGGQAPPTPQVTFWGLEFLQMLACHLKVTWRSFFYPCRASPNQEQSKSAIYINHDQNLHDRHQHSRGALLNCKVISLYIYNTIPRDNYMYILFTFHVIQYRARSMPCMLQSTSTIWKNLWFLYVT